MFYWHGYPYTNFHELNLDWVLEQVRSNKDAIEQLQKNAEISRTLPYRSIDEFITEESTVDASAALQTALNTCAYEGSALFIPNKTYPIKSTYIFVPNNTILFGQGVLEIANDGIALIMQGSNDNGGESHNILISGITFYNKSAAEEAQGCYAPGYV